MAGIKRPQSDDTDKSQSKKLKTDSTNKSDKKHALKMARKDSKSTTKTSQPEGKDNLTIQLKEKKEKKSKSEKNKTEKKVKKAPVEEAEDEVDEMEVDDVNEDEFQGFSTDPVEAPAFRPLSDDEDSEEAGDEDEEKKPAKKSKKGEEKAEVNTNHPNGMFTSLLLAYVYPRF